MRKRRPIDATSEDADLFTREFADVKRLRHNQAPGPAGLQREHARRVSATVETNSVVESSETLRFLRPGVQETQLTRLRRGQIAIDAELDLHGFTSHEAHVQLSRFLLRARTRGHRAVRVIHGKGFSSAGRQPVLKAKLDRWLREDEGILAFTSAQPRNGGTGAVEILLRR